MKSGFKTVTILLILLFLTSKVTAQTGGYFIRFVNELGHPVHKGLHTRVYDNFGIEYELIYKKDSIGPYAGVFYCKAPVAKLKLTDSSGTYKYLDTIIREFTYNELKTITLRFTYNNYMDGIVISVDKAGSKVKESPVSLTVVQPYLLQNKIATALNDIVDQIPGVSFTDQQVNIRGGSGWSYGAGSRVMVMVDELPMLSGDANAVQWSFLPIENLESVEVIKSAGSVLYGSGALNGAINLRTAEAKEKAEGRFTVFSGMYNQPSVSSWRIDKRNHFMNGSNGFFSQRYKNTGVVLSYNSIWDEGYRLNEITRRARLNFKIKQYSKKHKDFIYGLNGGIQRGKTGSFLLWESDQLPYTSLDSGFTYSTQWRINFDPYAGWKTGKVNHKITGRYLFTDNAIQTQDTGVNQSNSGIATYGEYKAAFEVQKIQFTSGLVGMYNRTNSPLFSGFQTSHNLAFYTQLQRRWKRLIVNIGGRYENFWLNSTYFNKPVFRAGINYALTKFTYLRASAGQGYRFPSMAEAFISTSAGPVTVFPNPSLKPESGNNYELGIKQAYRIGSFKGYLDVSLFQIRIDNIMEFTFAQWSSNLFPPTYGFGFKSVNAGSGKISGFEIETAGEGKLGKVNLKLMAGYTFTNPVNTTPDLVFARDSTPSHNPMTFLNTRSDSVMYLKYRQRNMFKLDMQFNWRMLEWGLSLKLGSRIENIDKAFETFPMNIIVPGIKESRAKYAYTRIVDLRAGAYLSEKVKINFQVQNLFNSISISRPADMRPPRLFQLQVVYRLGEP